MRRNGEELRGERRCRGDRGLRVRVRGRGHGGQGQLVVMTANGQVAVA
jgi:hypothetical protein